MNILMTTSNVRSAFTRSGKIDEEDHENKENSMNFSNIDITPADRTTKNTNK